MVSDGDLWHKQVGREYQEVFEEASGVVGIGRRRKEGTEIVNRDIAIGRGSDPGRRKWAETGPVVEGSVGVVIQAFGGRERVLPVVAILGQLNTLTGPVQFEEKAANVVK